MHRYFILLTIALLAIPSSLFAQNQEEKSPAELASEEAERMAELFKFNDYQLYQADSMLNVNYSLYYEEFNKLQRSGAQNPTFYQNVQTKYQELIESAYQKIMTEEQWAKFMKSSYGKDKKKRDNAQARSDKKDKKKR